MARYISYAKYILVLRANFMDVDIIQSISLIILGVTFLIHIIYHD